MDANGDGHRRRRDCGPRRRLCAAGPAGRRERPPRRARRRDRSRGACPPRRGADAARSPDVPPQGPLTSRHGRAVPPVRGGRAVAREGSTAARRRPAARRDCRADPSGDRGGDEPRAGDRAGCAVARLRARAPGLADQGARVTELSYREAVTAALAAELERDPAVIVLGEDVVLGGVWVTTPGLAERFRDRIVDTPISELAFTG